MKTAAGITKVQWQVGLTLLAAVLATPCPVQAGPTEDHYAAAVRDASVVLPSEVVHNLVAISPDNPNLVWNSDHTKILVVSWKSRSSYDSYLKGQTHTSSSEDYVIWVTTAPQVQHFCQNFIQTKPQGDLNLRLKQYLGLAPGWNYDLFVEMWVDPAQIFRPCVDPEIDDATCNLKFTSTVPTVAGIADYATFYQNLYFNDFRYPPASD